MSFIWVSITFIVHPWISMTIFVLPNPSISIHLIHVHSWISLTIHAHPYPSNSNHVGVGEMWVLGTSGCWGNVCWGTCRCGGPFGVGNMWVSGTSGWWVQESVADICVLGLVFLGTFVPDSKSLVYLFNEFYLVCVIIIEAQNWLIHWFQNVTGIFRKNVL